MLAGRVLPLLQCTAASALRQCRPVTRPCQRFFFFRQGPSVQLPIDKMVKEFVDAQIKGNKITMFSKTYCPYCKMGKEALSSVGVTDYNLIELDLRDDFDPIQDYLKELTGGRTVPRVFINGKFVGGGSELKAMAANGELKKLVDA